MGFVAVAEVDGAVHRRVGHLEQVVDTDQDVYPLQKMHRESSFKKLLGRPTMLACCAQSVKQQSQKELSTKKISSRIKIEI